MRASSGPWQELARLFVDDFPDIFALMKDCNRAKDFQLALACFSQIVEVMHPSSNDGVPIFKQTHSALPKLLKNKSAVDNGIKSHLASVWTTLNGLVHKDPDTFTNAKKYIQGVQTFAPIEMVAITVLISMYSNTRNHALLLGDIQAMCRVLRENFSDLRMNHAVWKFVWDYLDSLERITGAVDGSTVKQKITGGDFSVVSQPPQSAKQPANPNAIASSSSATTIIAPPITQSEDVRGQRTTDAMQSLPKSKRKRLDPVSSIGWLQRATSHTEVLPSSDLVPDRPLVSPHFKTESQKRETRYTGTGSKFTATAPQLLIQP